MASYPVVQPRAAIRILSLLEASVVTSPVSIVLRFACDTRPQIDLRIVTFAREQRANPFTDAVSAAGIPLHIIQEAGRFDRAALGHLRALVNEHRPDVVHTNSIKSHFLVALLGRKRSFGWLASHHGYTAEDVKMRLYNQLDRYSLRRADRVVTVCRAFARDLTAMGVADNKLTVIPNSIPAGFLQRNELIAEEWRQRLGIQPGERVVFTAGRLSPEKGHRFLVEAAAILARSSNGPRFKILIAGSGLLENALAEQVRHAGLSDIVRLVGHVPDIKPLFMLSDIFVLPSLSEWSPMVLLESMAAGIPVISSAVGGIPEAVKHNQTAVLVPPADPAALASAISALLTDPQRARAIVDAALTSIAHDFTPALYNRRLVAAFESVLATRTVQ